jgi:hypothetical protein
MIMTKCSAATGKGSQVSSCERSDPRGRAVIFSTEFEPGQRLESWRIAAILRFRAVRMKSFLCLRPGNTRNPMIRRNLVDDNSIFMNFPCPGVRRTRCSEIVRRRRVRRILGYVIIL